MNNSLLVFISLFFLFLSGTHAQVVSSQFDQAVERALEQAGAVDRTLTQEGIAARLDEAEDVVTFFAHWSELAKALPSSSNYKEAVKWLNQASVLWLDRHFSYEDYQAKTDEGIKLVISFQVLQAQMLAAQESSQDLLFEEIFKTFNDAERIYDPFIAECEAFSTSCDLLLNGLLSLHTIRRFSQMDLHEFNSFRARLNSQIYKWRPSDSMPQTPEGAEDFLMRSMEFRIGSLKNKIIRAMVFRSGHLNFWNSSKPFPQREQRQLIELAEEIAGVAQVIATNDPLDEQHFTFQLYGYSIKALMLAHLMERYRYRQSPREWLEQLPQQIQTYGFLPEAMKRQLHRHILTFEYKKELTRPWRHEWLAAIEQEFTTESYIYQTTASYLEAIDEYIGESAEAFQLPWLKENTAERALARESSSFRSSYYQLGQLNQEVSNLGRMVSLVSEEISEEAIDSEAVEHEDQIFDKIVDTMSNILSPGQESVTLFHNTLTSMERFDRLWFINKCAAYNSSWVGDVGDEYRRLTQPEDPKLRLFLLDKKMDLSRHCEHPGESFYNRVVANWLGGTDLQRIYKENEVAVNLVALFAGGVGGAVARSAVVIGMRQFATKVIAPATTRAISRSKFARWFFGSQKASEVGSVWLVNGIVFMPALAAIDIAAFTVTFKAVRHMFGIENFDLTKNLGSTILWGVGAQMAFPVVAAGIRFLGHKVIVAAEKGLATTRSGLFLGARTKLLGLQKKLGKVAKDFGKSVAGRAWDEMRLPKTEALFSSSAAATRKQAIKHVMREFGKLRVGEFLVRRGVGRAISDEPIREFLFGINDKMWTLLMKLLERSL